MRAEGHRKGVTLGVLARYWLGGAAAIALLVASWSEGAGPGWLPWGLAVYTAAVWGAHVADLRLHDGRILPHSVVVGGWEAYFIGGIAVYIVRDRIWYNYSGDIQTVFMIGCAMTLSLWLGVYGQRLASGGPRRDRGSRAGAWALRPRRLDAVGFVLAAVSYAGAAGMYLQLGYLPSLSGSIDAARVQAGLRASGFLLPMIMLSILSIGLFYADFMVSGLVGLRRSRLGLVMRMVLVFPPLLAYGGRFFVFMPLLVVVLMWMWEPGGGSARIWAMPLIAAGAVSAAMYLLVIRIYGAGATAAQAFRGVLNDLFPEARTFAMALFQVPRGGLWANIVGPVATGLIPGTVAEWIGLDKEALFRPIGGVIYASLYQFNANSLPGIRIGAVGEFYLAFGTLGVVALSVAVGFSAASVDRLVLRGQPVPLFFGVVIVALLIALEPYGSVFLVTVMTMMLPAWAVVVLVRRRLSGAQSDDVGVAIGGGGHT